MSRIKRVNAITFLNNFVAGALTLLIPLLLLARNVNLAEIGLVVSALPLIFLVARLLLAAIADRVGWSHIFLIVNWPATFLATAIYFVANSLPVFLAGKVMEGLRDASYWAVNRTAIFDLASEDAEKEATRNNAVIWLATAVGSAIAGLGIAYVGFSSSLLLLMVASATLGIPAAMLWRTRRAVCRIKNRLRMALDPRGKSRGFWMASIALMFNSVSTYPLLTLLLPVFMQEQLGYNYLTIGILFMVYNFVAAATTLATLKMSLSLKRMIAQSLIAFIASILMASSGSLFSAFFFALAFARGFGVAFFEHLVARVAKNSQNVCVDIGWLHVPMRLAEFASVMAAGFAVQAVGYAPVFTVTGLFFVVFSFMSYRQLRSWVG